MVAAVLVAVDAKLFRGIRGHVRNVTKGFQSYKNMTVDRF